LPIPKNRASQLWTRYTRETLPQPNNPAVQIVEVPGETTAVLRFSNSRSAEAIAKQTRAVAGTAVTLLYDPPWTLPFFRRNEVAVPVRSR